MTRAFVSDNVTYMNTATTPTTPTTARTQILPNGQILYVQPDIGGGIRRWYTEDGTIQVSLMWHPRLTAANGNRYKVTINGRTRNFDQSYEARRWVRVYFQNNHGVAVTG